MRLLITCVAAAVALVACGKDDRPKTAPASGGSTATTQPQSTTPTTPANVGTPSAAEKSEGANPQQQQVDPKEAAQRRDFQHKDDGAGPKSPETAPRN